MREFSCVPAALGAAGAPAFLGEELAVAGPSRAVPELQQWRLVANAQAGGSPAVASDFESGGHGLMVVHVSRDPDDSADRDTEISYAYSSELGGSVAGGSFEEHGRIANNKRAEGAPTVAFDTAGRAVCAWVQVKSENTVSSDPSTVPPQMEIVWSRYDPDSDAWSAPAALTADAYLDYSPRLLRGPTGGLLVYWLRNKKNSPIADATAPLQVRYAVWNPAAAAFGAVATLPGDIASCAGLSLAWNETRFVAAYAQDLDGNLADGTDCEIFTMVHDGTGWSSPQRVTTNSVADRNPRVLFAIPQGDTAEYHLVWLQDGKIVQRHPVTGAVAVLREADRDPEFFDFELLGNRWGEIGVFWRDEGDGQPDIFYRLLGLQMVAYVPGSELIDYRTRWSGEMRLVDDASSEDQLAGAWADNTIDLAFVTTDPGSGQVDLRYAAKRFFWPDLVIGPDDVWITPADAAPGQAVTVHARVRNLGDGEAPKLSFYPNLHVAFYQGDPAAGGTLIKSVLVYTWPDQALVGGSSVEVSVPWSLPVSVPSIDQARVYVLADPFDGPGLTDGIDELSDANNTGSFQFRPVDLEATMLRVDELGGGSVSIVGTISNKGAVPVAGAEVSCQLDGVEQGTRVVPALGEDEGADVVFYMPAGYSGRPTCLVTLTVDPANRFEETDEGNNVQNYGASTDQTPLPAGGTDSDGDGMADAWEATHLGDLSRDGTGDLDGDGMSDGEEHSAGTDPADGASALVVSGLGLADGGISLSWQGAKGKTYQVEFCPDLLTGSWTRLDSGCYAGEDGTIVVQDVPTSPSGFYRVTIDDSFEPPLQSPR